MLTYWFDIFKMIIYIQDSGGPKQYIYPCNQFKPNPSNERFVFESIDPYIPVPWIKAVEDIPNDNIAPAQNLEYCLLPKQPQLWSQVACVPHQVGDDGQIITAWNSFDLGLAISASRADARAARIQVMERCNWRIYKAGLKQTGQSTHLVTVPDDSP